MTREDIIRMAEEAGFEYLEYMNDSVYAGDELGSLTKFAKLVASYEREEAAKLCEADAKKLNIVNYQWAAVALSLATRIRART